MSRLYKCRDCGRQFVEYPQTQPKGPDTWSKIKLLLLERISLAGIARVMDVSEIWLLCESALRGRRPQSLGYSKGCGKMYGANG